VALTITELRDSASIGTCAFTTRQAADPVGFVRTRGVVVNTPRELDRVLAANPVDDSDERPAASGKVAVLEDDGTLLVRVHQRADGSAHAVTVACSNATAAASTAFAGDRALSFALALPSGQTIAVDTQTRALASGEHAVVQTWYDVRVDVDDVGIVDGRRVAACRGPLNDYLLVGARPSEPDDKLTLDEARRLWDRFGFLDSPLRARLAFLRGIAPTPRASFFTCGGRAHPSAPLTGLAVLAVARRRLDWPEIRGLEVVETSVGPIALPNVWTARDGASTFEFPSVVVQLDHP
jgi:hypothetical protein